MENQPLEHNPWLDAETRYQPGQEVHGTVSRVTHFGVLVQIEPGLEGIIYTFELGPGAASLAGFAPGQEMRLYVQSVDASRRRMELSLNNQPVPGLLAEGAIPAALRRSKVPSEQSWSASLPPLPEVPPAQPGPACPNCQHPVEGTWKHCVYCGCSFQRHCPGCGNVQPDLPDARYCWECGKLLA